MCLGNSRPCLAAWVLGPGRIVSALTPWWLSVWQPVPWLAFVPAALGRAGEDG